MTAPRKQRVAVVTGTRAEFGLLRPVIAAMRARPDLDVKVIAAGAHLLPPAHTINEVRAEVGVDAEAPMQTTWAVGRLADAAALGRGIEALARIFGELRPDWVLVLGDRIEAFAGAAAASVGGIAVAHIHGGDRAEGIADEALRHAATKLAHLHLAASPASAERIIRLGEPRQFVHTVGSPAIDGLASIAPMTDADAQSLGDPRLVILLHPSGLPEPEESALAEATLAAAAFWSRRTGAPVLAMAPNHDPGREIIAARIESTSREHRWRRADHLSRLQWIALLKRLASHRGVLLGNSSAGLIECAALGLGVVNVGPRQNGRERAANVIDAPSADARAIEKAIDSAAAISGRAIDHPYGDGRAGERIAALLAATDARAPSPLRKRCTF